MSTFKRIFWVAWLVVAGLLFAAYPLYGLTHPTLTLSQVFLEMWPYLFASIFMLIAFAWVSPFYTPDHEKDTK